MNTIKYLAAATAFLCAAAAVSCSDNDEPQEETVNHIYLNVPDGTTSITQGTDESVTVAVTLSSAAKQAMEIEFGVDATDAALVIEDNPVSIAAGSTTGYFTVKASSSVTLSESTSYTFKLVSEGLYDLKENVTITVLPAPESSNLTAEQKALVEGWKTKYGVDLTPWIGNIKLTGTLQFPGDGVREPFVAPGSVNLAGSTTFSLSAESDSDTPVLDMVENPMGMADYLYRSFLQLTVDDKEYFALENDGTGLELMNLINWNSSSSETFAVTLPGLRITSISGGKATVEFVTEGDNYIYDSNGKPIYNAEYEMDLTYNWATSWIPFNYTYSAWTRQLGLIENGDPQALELLTLGSSAAPASYLGISDVLEDAWEIDEEEDGVANLYVTPRGEIDFNAGTMTFEFPFDHMDQYGYSRVNVVYSLQ